MVANRKARAPARRKVEEATLAQRDAAIDELRAVLKLFDRKSYMGPEQQQAIARADALVAESERW